MILTDICDYLEQRGQASLADLAMHFDTPQEALRGMLAVWIRKGIIHKRPATTACGSSCSQCDSAETELYLWGSGHYDSGTLLPVTCTREK